MLPTQIRVITMKKFTYLLTLITISLCFVQCETNKIGQNGVHKGHEYVDLGLPSGLKWATYNVGATAPEESGEYFAWGEVEPSYSSCVSLTQN